MRFVDNNRLTAEQFRLRFPSPEYRVTPKQYPSGVCCDVSSRAGSLIVIKGRCRFSWEGGSLELGPGDMAEQIQDGTYTFEVLDDLGVEFIRAWKLPDFSSERDH